MRTLVLKEVSVDQGHNPLAQRLILCEVRCIEDLEPDAQIRVADENSRIRLVAVSPALQEPALVRVRVFRMETRVQALDNVPRETIIDPRAIIFAKDDPGLALRIPDDVLSAASRTGDEEGPVGRWAHGLFFS